MHTIHAIYENGVFRPLGEVHLPEPTEVEFEPRPRASSSEQEAAKKRVWETLSEEFDGEPDLAAQFSADASPFYL